MPSSSRAYQFNLYEALEATPLSNFPAYLHLPSPQPALPSDIPTPLSSALLFIATIAFLLSYREIALVKAQSTSPQCVSCPAESAIADDLVVENVFEGANLLQCEDSGLPGVCSYVLSTSDLTGGSLDYEMDERDTFVSG
ncbi:hypothetical protein BKA70DRAFT_1422324 [Coprinopsis sp. MPI-PUGE-AT-0042]|nr:hypothetical protein BKA70DRAFT_1422324 [Coprinopsis sp. MPI-PUGE-AT-0042]